MDMFCYQCEQTAGGQGCTKIGVCGKDDQTAAMQDMLVYACMGISQYAHRARQCGVSTPEIDRFIPRALFVTLTNVNFDADRITTWIREAASLKDRARDVCINACGQQPDPDGPAQWMPAEDTAGLQQQAEEIRIAKRLESNGPDITGLQELVLYGLKGMGAYADHARILGVENEEVYAFFHEALAFLADRPTDVDDLVAMAMRVGEVNLQVMGMLDEGHTKTFGHPEPTQARVTPVKGKCIVVSGHDLVDLHALLRQTEGRGVNVYTHGEMLPSLAYPELKKFSHLVGNYGGAWQDQQKEFADFPGAILMTTNCIMEPKDGYRDRIFTSGVVGWPGVQHVEDHDFEPVIQAALAEEGFQEDAPEKTIPIGFAHNTVMSVAEKVLEAVQAGQVRHVFLVGGCDGARPGRNYYTDLAERIPEDCLILTLACGKYRFNKLDFGTIGGLPRLLDVGQCNDAYSAIVIAQGLAEALGCGVNDLPLSLILSWYEQKAVCILLTLLSLGIRDMRLGPTLPAFIGPEVLRTLQEKLNLQPTTTAEADLEAVLNT